MEEYAYEFAQVNDFVNAADEITQFPYRDIGWGKFDILVLPGSFPFGGMENPTLTFVTPTIVCGDRSCVSVCIHELCHSWFGNLLTNHTWEDFWLNEGFTVWLERKIVGKLEGNARRDMEVVSHDVSLRTSLENFSGTPAGLPCALIFTYVSFLSVCFVFVAISLVTDLTCTDPDDFFSSIPYEKGSQFLYWLEKAIVQDSVLFEKCIQAWVKENAYKTITSEQFRAFFETYFSENVRKTKHV